MGYYAIYQRSMMPIGQIDWNAMTHLAVGAVLPRANGSLDTTFYVDATHGPTIAKHLASAARAHGVTPILMVGGAGVHDGFAAAATNHRAKLVKNLLAVMKSEGFAGLDLDWEPVHRVDQAPLRELVDALRRQAPHAILTMPVLWVTKTFPRVPKLFGTLADKLDRIDIMSYGMAGAYQGWKTWHSSALKGATATTPSDVALNINAYEKAGVPAHKLGVGAGFYGTCWTGGVTGPDQKIGNSSIVADDGTMSYRHIMARYYSKSAYHYDRTAQAPYLSFKAPTGPQKCTFLSYENPRSVAAKGAYAEKRGLGSEVIWTINQGHIAGHDPLLADVRRSFH